MDSLKDIIKTIIAFVNHHRKMVLTGVLLSLVLSLMIFSTHGLLTRSRLIDEKVELAKQIEREKEIRDSLLKRIDMLENDLSEIERIAREQYGMIKPGEILYLFKKDTVRKEDEDD